MCIYYEMITTINLTYPSLRLAIILLCVVKILRCTILAIGIIKYSILGDIQSCV
jgi:hypothetical protein